MAELYDVKCPECSEVVLKSPNDVDQAIIDIVMFHYIKCFSESKGE